MTAALMGAGSSKLAFAGRPPTVILLAGLQGSGKTTAAAKLALLLRKEGRNPGLVAADLQRPAAVDQLEQLGKQIQVPVYRAETVTVDPVTVVREGIRELADAGVDTIVLDTAGRLHVDEELMDELERVRAEAKPANVLLVLDAMTGQEAVNVALAFQERVAFDGLLKTNRTLRRMGSIQGLLKMIPGLGKQLEGLDQVDEKQFGRVEAIILSMTPQERALPRVIDGSRRGRIARGSGTTVEEVNRLLDARKQMETLMKGMRKGKLPALGALTAGAGSPPAGESQRTRKATKSNKRKKRQKS